MTTGKAKILQHAHRNGSGLDDLLAELKFSGSPADMSTIRGAGARFVVNLDGKPAPTSSLVEDGVLVRLVRDDVPHVVEFFIDGRSVFRKENIKVAEGVSFPLSLAGGSSTPAMATKRFVVTVREQPKRVTAFQVGAVRYAAAEMGSGTGVYTSDQVVLPIGVESTVTLVYADESTTTATVNPPASATEIELSPHGDSRIVAPANLNCSLSAEVLAQLNLSPSSICQGNVIEMSNGAKYRVEIDGNAARLVLIPKEEGLVEKYAIPATMVAAGVGLLWHGMATRKAAEAKAAAKQNPFARKK